jgi:hypothetical protein
VRVCIPAWSCRQGPVTGKFEQGGFPIKQIIFLNKENASLSQAEPLTLEFVMKPFRILIQI